MIVIGGGGGHGSDIGIGGDGGGDGMGAESSDPARKETCSGKELKATAPTPRLTFSGAIIFSADIAFHL
jgi:hypothetical protein